ncbi:hypothetical protein DFH27DRAFT_15773 [Peziza echinospora]|nr:hypothetical protein DFH27DRAFT_15773 [Peziza echinospora]
MSSRPKIGALGRTGPIQWNRSYLSVTDSYREHSHSGASMDGLTDVDSDEDGVTRYFGRFSSSESDSGDGLGRKCRKKPSYCNIRPTPSVTVTYPPLPQVGTALQSNVRRLGRTQEERLMRRWGGEGHGKRDMGHNAIMLSDDSHDDDGGSCGIYSGSEQDGLRLKLSGGSDLSGASEEDKAAEAGGDKRKLKMKKKKKKTKKGMGRADNGARLAGGGGGGPEKGGEQTQLVLGGRNHSPPYYEGGSLSVVTIRKGKKNLKSAHSNIPKIVVGPPQADDEPAEAPHDPEEVVLEEPPRLPLSRTSFRWGRRVLEASPKLTRIEEFEKWCEEGTEFVAANIRIGFADGLYDYPSSDGYSWILQSMLSDPLVLQLEASLHAVAQRPEFTVDCRWLTENDLFIIIDTLTPGDISHASHPQPQYCSITGELLSRRRFRTPNNRPYVRLGGWTGDSTRDNSVQQQCTFVERYFIWVNRDGKTVKEGSARWPPSLARKKSSKCGLELPEGTPKEQYSVVIGHDSGLDPSLKGEQPTDIPSGLKILERHIKVKLETDKDWLRKMIQAPAYWIVQEIITTLLDGKLKGLLGEARRRVNKERKRALEAESLQQGVINLSGELDMMQELVGIMEEYIRFVSGFEVAYHNAHTQNDSDSGSGTGHAQTKNSKKKKNKKKRGIPPPDREVKREFMMLRRSLEGYRDCLVDIKEDIEYTIQMVFSTAQAKQSSDALEQSELAYYQAGNMSKQTKMVMHQTDKMTHQAESMRRLTYLALFFLPATFIATIFGMNVIELAMPSISIFFAIAVPTTLIVFGAAYWYDSTREMVSTTHLLDATTELPCKIMQGNSLQNPNMVKRQNKAESTFKGSLRLHLPNRYTGTLHNRTSQNRNGNIGNMFQDTPAIEVYSPPKELGPFEDGGTKGQNSPELPKKSLRIEVPNSGDGIIEVPVRNPEFPRAQFSCNRMSTHSQVESPKTLVNTPTVDGYFRRQPHVYHTEATSPPISLAPSIASQSELRLPHTTGNNWSEPFSSIPQGPSAPITFALPSTLHNPNNPTISHTHHGVYGPPLPFLDVGGRNAMGSRRGSLLEPEPTGGPRGNSFNNLFLNSEAAYKARARQRSIITGDAGLDDISAHALAVRGPSKEFERRLSQRLRVEDSNESDEPSCSPRTDVPGGRMRRNKWGLGRLEKEKEGGPEDVV